MHKHKKNVETNQQMINCKKKKRNIQNIFYYYSFFHAYFIPVSLFCKILMEMFQVLLLN